MISIDQLLDGVTVSVEPLTVEPGSAPGSVRACGTAGVVHLVGGARLYCSPDNVVVLPARGCGHCDLGPGRGFRTGAGRIRVTYRGAVGLFDTLREPLVQVLTADDPVWPAFEETLGELLTQRPGARAMAEALLRRWVILLFRRWWAD